MLGTDDTPMANSQYSMSQLNHSGPNMDENSLGKPYGPTVGHFDVDLESGVEMS